jgi:arabinose-5-phosphate isomerase
MTRNPVTVARGAFAVEALRLMEERKITSIVVVGADQEVEGIVHLHDLWRTQFV